MPSVLALRPSLDLGFLTEEFRRQENQVLALVSSLSAVPLSPAAPALLRKDPLSSAAFVDEDDYADGEHLMYAGTLIPSEELPSGTDASLPTIDTTKRNLQHSIKELLEMKEVRLDGRARGGNTRRRATGVNRRNDVRTVPIAPIPVEEGTPAGRQGRTGWQNNPEMAVRMRTMTNDDYFRMRSRLICFLCYASEHISRSCSIDHIMQAYQVLSNWHNFTGASSSRVCYCEYADRSPEGKLESEERLLADSKRWHVGGATCAGSWRFPGPRATSCESAGYPCMSLV